MLRTRAGKHQDEDLARISVWWQIDRAHLASFPRSIRGAALLCGKAGEQAL
jgi:hypothetical protein